MKKSKSALAKLAQEHEKDQARNRSRSASRERDQRWSDYRPINATLLESELTTTNMSMSMASPMLSVISSVSEIGVDAWNELGEDDFLVSPKKGSTRSLCSRSSVSGSKKDVASKSASRAGPSSINPIQEEIENPLNDESALQEFHVDNNELCKVKKLSSTNNFVSTHSFSREPHLYEQKDNLGPNESVETIMSMNGEGSSTTSIAPSESDPLEGDDLDDFNNKSTFYGTQEHVIKQILAKDYQLKKQQSNKGASKITKMIVNNSSTTRKSKDVHKNAKGSRKRLPSTPPGKHRIAIYDSQVQNKQGASIIPGITPLHCDFVSLQNEPNTSKPTGYHHVYISDKEYRLLQSFLPPQKRKVQKIAEQPKVESPQRTLFGWVTAASNATSHVTTPQDSSQVQIPLEYQRSRSRLCQFPPSTSSSFQDVGEGTNSEFLLNLAKTTSSSAQTHTLSDIEWGMMQTYDSLTCSKTGLVLPKDFIRNDELETSAGIMRQGILNASETSVVLMNTIFKEILADGSSASTLDQNPQFQDFIKSTNEIEALEKAAIIFATAKENIFNYLMQLRKEYSSTYNKNPEIISMLETSPQVGNSYNVDLENRFIELENANIIIPASSLNGVDNAIDTSFWDSQNNSPGGPQYFQLSIINKPGIILETIHCHNYEFSMVYSGSPLRINLLESATREKAETIHLNPQRLLEMIDRNASFASGRIISSKYYIAFVSNQFGTLVQKFISGKYSKPNLSLKWNSRVARKLRSINTFSGIILQTSTAFFSVCKKIKVAIEKAMRLDDVLRIPRLPGLTQNTVPISSNSFFGKFNLTQDYGLPIGTKMPMKEALIDLSSCVNEIDTILVTLKKSLDALNYGVQVKKSYRKKIEYFFLAVKQLEFGHDIDFGTVIMSLACNAAVVQSLSNVVPTVDVEMRSRILANLGHLNWGSGELVKLVKKICLLSSFVSTKSIGRLRRMILMEKVWKLNKKSWFSSTKAITPNKNIKGNLMINSETVDETRKETEKTKLKQLKQDLTEIHSLD